MGKHKDGYEDILEERRHTSDFAFAFRSQPNVPRYKYNKERDPNQIKQHVLHSDRVQYRIEMVCESIMCVPSHRVQYCNIDLHVDVVLVFCFAKICDMNLDPSKIHAHFAAK